MKRAAKAEAKRGAKRDLFAELSEGMEVLADARHGKRALLTHTVKYKPAPRITPQELIPAIGPRRFAAEQSTLAAGKIQTALWKNTCNRRTIFTPDATLDVFELEPLPTH